MHAEQLKVLHALRPVGQEPIKDTLVLGQYEGYRQEKLVGAHSQTDTYAALRLFIDNDRWRGAPFYIRTGKKLGEREMNVVVTFRRPPVRMLRITFLSSAYSRPRASICSSISRNTGDTTDITQAKMDFCQSCLLENRINTPEAYERLIGACIRGEHFWFSQWDQIETGWEYVEQLRTAYREAGLPLVSYPTGSSGPVQADRLLERFGHAWFRDL